MGVWAPVRILTAARLLKSNALTDLTLPNATGIERRSAYMKGVNYLVVLGRTCCCPFNQISSILIPILPEPYSNAKRVLLVTASPQNADWKERIAAFSLQGCRNVLDTVIKRREAMRHGFCDSFIALYLVVYVAGIIQYYSCQDNGDRLEKLKSKI